MKENRLRYLQHFQRQQSFQLSSQSGSVQKNTFNLSFLTGSVYSNLQCKMQIFVPQPLNVVPKKELLKSQLWQAYKSQPGISQNQSFPSGFHTFFGVTLKGISLENTLSYLRPDCLPDSGRATPGDKASEMSRVLLLKFNICNYWLVIVPLRLLLLVFDESPSLLQLLVSLKDILTLRSVFFLSNGLMLLENISPFCILATTSRLRDES